MFELMRTFVNLLISLVLAVWIMAIAIISVQNATPVALSFIKWRSIQIPMGLVIAFSVAMGILVVAVLQPIWALGEQDKGRFPEEAEFFVDNEDF
jgi:uncharacterized integral membrane protein